MARRKQVQEPDSTTATQEPPAPHEQPDFDDAIAARQQAAAVASDLTHSTRLPEDPVPLESARGHAAKVGQQKPGYTAAGKRDAVIGASHREYQDKENRIYLSIIKFDEKPSPEVIKMLRASEFDWNQENKEWIRPVRFATRQQDRITADRIFDDVCQMIRQERGTSHDFGGV